MVYYINIKRVKKMYKILFLIISLIFSNIISANTANWKDLEENFDSKINLPRDLEKKLKIAGEKNYYLYCYNNTSYITNTNKKEKLRFITPIIARFKHRNFNDEYYEYYNCETRAKNINITLLDKENNVLCINGIAYKNGMEGLLPLFQYNRYLRTRVGKPLNCENYNQVEQKKITLVDQGVYCINDFVYFKKSDAENILPLYSELKLNIREDNRRSYNFNYHDKQHPLFCRGGSTDDYNKSGALMSDNYINGFYVEHGKKYHILQIDKKKYLIPIINQVRLPISFDRPTIISIPAGIN